MLISISDKAIARAIGYILDGDVYQRFDANVIKTAGAPKRADAIKTIMADEKFQARLGRDITRAAENSDTLTDHVCGANSNSKYLIQLIRDCERAQETMVRGRELLDHVQTTQRMIAQLESEGYTVTPA